MIDPVLGLGPIQLYKPPNRLITTYWCSDLHRIRRTQQKVHLSPETWKWIDELGIRRRYRSQRGGANKRITPTPSCPDFHIKSPGQVLIALDKPSASAWFPDILSANVRSIKPKIDELQSVVELNNAGIVCITETWLGPLIPDEAINLSGFCVFRKDRDSPGGSGGVCACVSCRTPCRRLSDYELPEIESLWLTIRPYRLPRVVSVILLGIVYQPPNKGSAENIILMDHMKRNTEAFLCKHRDGLVVICGDFNSLSTGIIERQVKHATGLTQLVKVLTRDTGTLDWCLTNRPKLFSSPLTLPKLGRSDHHTLLIKPATALHQHAPSNQRVYTRDVRPSRISDFGRWITQYEWSNVLNLKNVQDKYDMFQSIITKSVNRFLPLKGFRFCSSD